MTDFFEVLVAPRDAVSEPARDVGSRSLEHSCRAQPNGNGDGANAQKDDLGYPTRPRDLTVGVFIETRDADCV